MGKESSVGEDFRLNGKVIVELRSMERIGATRYTSKYPGCEEMADCGETMVGREGVGE